MDFVVGNEECTYGMLTDILEKSRSFEMFFQNWTKVANRLQIRAEAKERIRMRLNFEMMPFTEAFREILSNWRSELGREAVLGRLLDVLDACHMRDAAESMRIKFGISTLISNDALASLRFIRSPENVDEFLTSASSVLIIRSTCSAVTATKLRQRFQVEFIPVTDLLTSPVAPSSTSFDRITTITVCEPTEVSVLLTDLSRRLSTFNGRKFIVITSTKFVAFESSFEQNMASVTEDDLKWNDLSEDSKNKVFSRVVLVQQHEVRLKEFLKILNDSQMPQPSGAFLDALVQDFVPNLFELNLPDKLQYYIPRWLTCRTCIDPKILQESGQHNDIFVFTGIQRHELRQLPGVSRTDTSRNQIKDKMALPTRFIVLDLKTDFEEICALTQRSVHWLHWEDDSKVFTWARSRGNLKHIQNHIVDSSKQITLSEEAFLKNILHKGQQGICLSDSPGMGKSVLLANIGRKIAQIEANANHLILFVLFPEFMVQIRKARRDNSDLSHSIYGILADYAGKSNFAKEVFFAGIESGGIQVDLLLDAYDEVNYRDTELAKECLQLIAEKPNIRPFVTSRPHLLQELEEILHVLGYNLIPFTEDDQLKFLTSFWISTAADPETLLTHKLLEVGQSCLKKMRQNLSDNEDSIGGTPLQCLLIAELFYEQAVNFSTKGNTTAESLSSDEIVINSLADLLDKSIEAKLKIYESRYFCSADKPGLFRIHGLHALQVIFPGEAITKTLSLTNLNNESVSTTDKLRLGILERTGSDIMPRFIHRTFAEYFATWLIAHLIQDEGTTTSTADVIDFMLEQLLTTTEFQYFMGGYLGQLKFFSCYFNERVMSTFINFHFQDVEKRQLIHKYNSKMKRLDRRRLARACVNNNLINLISFLLKLDLFTEDLEEIFDDQLVIICVHKSLLNMLFKVVQPFYEKTGRKLTNVWAGDLGGTSFFVLHVAIASANYRMVEYLCQSPDLVEKVQRGKVRHLLHVAVSHSTTFRKAGDTQERLEILNLLSSFSPEFLEERNAKQCTPLLCDYVDPELRLKLISLGANTLARTPEGDTILHRVMFDDTPEIMQQIVTAISKDGKETLKKLVLVRNGSQCTPLHVMLERFEPLQETLKTLSNAGADFNARKGEGQGETILAVAIQKLMKSETLEALVNFGADVNQVGDTRTGESLLQIATRVGNLDAVKLIISKGDPESSSSLFNAILFSDQGGNSEIAHFLLDNGADVNFANQSGQTPVHSASLGNLEWLRFLIEKKAVNVNCRDKNGNSPLHWALSLQKGPYSQAPSDQKGQNQFEIVHTLLEANADVRCTNNDGETPLEYALKSTNSKFLTDGRVLEILESNKAVNSSTIATLVLKHILSRVSGKQPTFPKPKYVALLKKLTVREADKDVVDSTGKTLLHLASETGYLEGVEFLVQRRLVAVNKEDNDGNTPLHYAVKNETPDRFDIARLLVSYQANVDALNQKEESPLIKLVTEEPMKMDFKLVEIFYGGTKSYPENILTPILNILLTHKHFIFGHPAIQELGEELVQHGATLSSNGTNLLHTAVKEGNLEGVRFLVKHVQDLDVNSRNKDDSTPLHLALLHNIKSLELIRFLADNGGDIFALNRDKQTTLMLAARKADPESIQFLLQKMPKVTSDSQRLHSFVNQVDKFGRTAFGYMIERQMTTTALEEIVQFGCEWKSGGYLVEAATTGNVEALCFLLSLGCDIRSKNSNGLTIMDLAVEVMTPEEFRKLVLHLQATGHLDECFIQLRSSRNQATTLHWAVYHLEVTEDTLDILVEAGVDFEAVDEQGYTVFAYAIAGQRSGDFLQSLMGSGAPWRTIGSYSSLHVASIWGNLPAVEFLTSDAINDFNINGREANGGNTPLHFAASVHLSADLFPPPVYYLNPSDALSEYVTKGILNMVDTQDNTLQNFYYKDGRERTSLFLEKLIKLGASWNHRNHMSDPRTRSVFSNPPVTTFLFGLEGQKKRLLANIGSKDKVMLQIAQRLLERGADVNALNDDNRTPLDAAIRGWNLLQQSQLVSLDLVKLLIDQGADVGSIGTPLILSYLQPKPFEEVITHLIEVGKFDELVTKVKGLSGETLLHYAVMTMELSSTLLEKLKHVKVDFSGIDAEGNSVIHYALLGGRSDLFVYRLMELGGKWIRNGDECYHESLTYAVHMSLSNASNKARGRTVQHLQSMLAQSLQRTGFDSATQKWV